MSVHYQGVLKSAGVIRELSEEVVDICRTLGWSYHRIADEDFEGVIFSPEGCEPVMLCFLPDGVLCSPVLAELGLEATLVSTKTQYAGMDAHIALIRMLRYLKEKYFRTFELTDEGDFWETDDVEQLRRQFERYNAALRAVHNALPGFEAVAGEDVTALADRPETFLRDKLGNGDLAE